MSWIAAASELSTDQVHFFPIPGNTPNSIAGALIIAENPVNLISSRFPRVHSLDGALFLMEHSQLSPLLSPEALRDCFKGAPHFFHPSYGLIALEELRDWSSFMSLNITQERITKPSKGLDGTDTLGNYFVREIEPEEVLKTLIKKSVPNPGGTLESKRLSVLEKVKLYALRLLVGKKRSKKKAKKSNKLDASKETVAPKAVNSAKKSWWKRKEEGMINELEDLEERNKKELEKLMDLLDKDPDHALKYALPIDRSGYSRGPEVGFTMVNRWSLRGNFGSGGSSGSVSLKDDQTNLLRQKYSSMADAYIQSEDWEKASFVYLELLSDPNRAANVLEKGKKYEAAAAIFLSRCKNSIRAADCYEKGKFYNRAIDLQQELDNQMKVGDLYTKMGDTARAEIAYTKEIAKMTSSNRFFEAGNVACNQLTDMDQAREHYKEGWKKGALSNKCLDAFLDTFALKEKRREIAALHQEELKYNKAQVFIDVLIEQGKKEQALKHEIEIVVFETIARVSKENPRIVESLKEVNTGELVSKDILRFRQSIKGRKL